ncbi:MAG: hypothetical protein JW932_18820, partial [Deltaproteobacteria bacterium]|nr:hypothetical protein [Deltaproteobacteria bacterium]
SSGRKVMSLYIVCQKKRNNPRMDIRICQTKCNMREQCKEYISIHQSMEQLREIHMSKEPRSMILQAA